MTRRSVVRIVATLNAGGIRYLIAGGLAVVAHGLVRFTADIDLILDPDPESLKRAVSAFARLQYKPRAPVAFEDFADAETRGAWVREKGLAVFSLFSPEHSATEVDLFVESPIDFELAYARAYRAELAPGVTATFVSLADLLEMKRQAGRKQDLEDVAGLESLGEEGHERP